MNSRLVQHLDTIADKLESIGLIKEASELDIISNTIEALAVYPSRKAAEFGLSGLSGPSLGGPSLYEQELHARNAPYRLYRSAIRMSSLPTYFTIDFWNTLDVLQKLGQNVDKDMEEAVDLLDKKKAKDIDKNRLLSLVSSVGMKIEEVLKKYDNPSKSMSGMVNAVKIMKNRFDIMNKDLNIILQKYKSFTNENLDISMLYGDDHIEDFLGRKAVSFQSKRFSGAVPTGESEFNPQKYANDVVAASRAVRQMESPWVQYDQTKKSQFVNFSVEGGIEVKTVYFMDEDLPGPMISTFVIGDYFGLAPILKRQPSNAQEVGELLKDLAGLIKKEVPYEKIFK